MRRISAKSAVLTAVPLILMALFALALSFPSLVPFLQVKHEAFEGLGTVSFKVDSTPFSVGFSLKKVPAGTSPRGCTDIPGGTSVQSPFLLAETETTSAVWSAVSARAEKDGFVLSGRALPGNDGESPVEGVSWRDAVVWCNALSVQFSLSPVYFTDSSFTEPVRSVAYLEASNDIVFVRADASGFRLPSNAEWELAARYIDGAVWSPGSYPSGGEAEYHYQSRSAEYAVFDAPSAASVKTLAPNRLGLYDMSGNVWEWCFDRMPDAFTAAGLDADGKRVVRGGSWAGNAYRLQIGGEFGSLPGVVERGQGFRIARSGW